MGKRNFVEIFNELLEEKGLSRKAFSVQSGIPYPTISGWTNLGRLPDFTALVKIADFFGCSVDYLTGREREFGERLGQVELSPVEESVVFAFRLLPADEKTLVVKLIDSLSK